jgi:hypothetical protein
MSSLIENAGRSIADSLPLVGVNDPSVKGQNLRGGELVKQLATGGLALGSGVGAAVVLVNYLKSMQQEAEIEDETRLNDDTLYLPSRKQEKAAAEVNRWLAPGLAVTGGVVAGGASYALTQAVYNYLQKKHRQKLLDEAQNETLVAADLEAEKSAASMSFADLATAFPVAVPLLAALASGGVAYAALNKTFPVVQPPKSKYPRRIRQVTEGGDVEIPEEAAQTKAASAADLWADGDCESAAMEFLALVTDRVAMEKGATCITSDILNRVGAEGPRELTSMLRDNGLPAVCEAVKGAACVSDDVKVMSAAVIFKSARLAPAVASVAAAELLDMLPNVMSLCKSASATRLDTLAGLGALMHMSWFRPQIVKAATALGEEHPLLQALMSMMASAPQQPPTPRAALVDGNMEDRDAALTSDISGSMGEDNEGDDSDPGSPKGDDDESQGDDDVIDTFMGDPKKAPPPTN